MKYQNDSNMCSNYKIKIYIMAFVHVCIFMLLYTVEPRYNEVLGTMKLTLLYQVSHYIRVKKQKYKELGPAK